MWHRCASCFATRDSPPSFCPVLAGAGNGEKGTQPLTSSASSLHTRTVWGVASGLGSSSPLRSLIVLSRACCTKVVSGDGGVSAGRLQLVPDGAALPAGVGSPDEKGRELGATWGGAARLETLKNYGRQRLCITAALARKEAE